MGLQPIEVFKEDRRSRVWLVHSASLGRVAIKRWEYSPWRQRAARLVGLHPGQREWRSNRRLAVLGIAVVPVLAGGVVRGWLGDRYWLATPLWGRSVQRWLTRGRGPTWAARRRGILGLARMADRLLHRGLVFRDLKTSNVIADAGGQVWLIDVGSVRRSVSRGPRLRMLAMLDKTAAGDGATRADRVRFLRALVGAWPELGDVRAAAKAILAARERLP